MANKVRWGALSTARIGRRVIPAIQQGRNCEVVAIASRDLGKAEAAAQELNIPKAYGSYEALLADPDIDAIYNPLPNDQHGLWSIRAAEAGKAVLCEKPIAIDAAEARKMARIFDERGLLLVEAFMWRFHPQHIRVKQMIDGGAVGQVHIINASFTVQVATQDDIRLKKEMAGGALMDVGCYCIQIMRFMTGEEPDEASALARFGLNPVDEIMVGALKFPSGVLGHFDCSLQSYWSQHYEIIGKKGRIRVEKAILPFVPDMGADATIKYWHSDEPTAHDECEEIRIPDVNQYTLMAEDFADALLNHHAPRHTVDDAVRNMELIDRLLGSAEQHK